MPSFKPVIALTRGLEILRVVNQERQATIRAIHAATGLDKATIVRMLETLEHEGYVMRDPDQAIYSPTGRTLVLSQGFDQHLWIGRTAESIMNEFRKRIGWPSDLAIFDRDAMILVHDAALLDVVDRWVAGVAAETFDDLLPLLRRTFSAFSTAERRSIHIDRSPHARGWSEMGSPTRRS